MEKLERQIKLWQYLYLRERGLNIVVDLSDGATRVYDGNTCLMYIEPDNVIDPEVKIFTDKLLKQELIAIVNNLGGNMNRYGNCIKCGGELEYPDPHVDRTKEYMPTDVLLSKAEDYLAEKSIDASEARAHDKDYADILEHDIIVKKSFLNKLYEILRGE